LPGSTVVNAVEMFEADILAKHVEKRVKP